MTPARPKVRWSPILQAWVVRRPDTYIGSMHLTLAEACDAAVKVWEQSQAADYRPDCYQCEMGDPHTVHLTALEFFGIDAEPTVVKGRA